MTDAATGWRCKRRASKHCADFAVEDLVGEGSLAGGGPGSVPRAESSLAGRASEKAKSHRGNSSNQSHPIQSSGARAWWKHGILQEKFNINNTGFI